MAGKHKTHCRRGHEFTPENSQAYTDSHGRRQRQCKACARVRRAKMLAGNPGIQRKYTLRQKYGLTPQAWDSILDAQGGLCPICHTDAPGERGWHVDHCHATGKIRGLLCHGCNAGMGNMRDDPERLRAAADYLERATVAGGR